MDIPIAPLTQEYGSPLYVYQLREVRASARALHDVLPQGHTLLYSVKANPLVPVISTLRVEGCGAEVSSAGEVGHAIEAGHDPARLFFTGPGKSIEVLRAVISQGVRTFSVESREDARRVASVSQERGIAVRTLMRLNVAAPGPISSLTMSGQAQFGMAFDEAIGVSRDMPEIFPSGLHIFQGSNVLDPELLIDMMALGIDTARRWIDAGQRLDLLNLGGGFGAVQARTGSRANYHGLKSQLERVLDEKLVGWRHGRPQLMFESGRYLVSSSGTLICTVQDIKVNHGKMYVVTDSGIHHLGGLSGLGRLMPVRPTVSRVSGEIAAAPNSAVTVVGLLCTPADSWGSIECAGLKIGDRITVPNVGAYGLTASLIAFLSQRMPREVVLDGSAVSCLVETSLLRSVLEPEL